MSLSTHYLEYGRHVAQLRCHCCHRSHRRAYVSPSNTTSHDNHEKINSWDSFSCLYEYGAPLGSPKGHRSSAILRAKTFHCPHAWDELFLAKAKPTKYCCLTVWVKFTVSNISFPLSLLRSEVNYNLHRIKYYEVTCCPQVEGGVKGKWLCKKARHC